MSLQLHSLSASKLLCFCLTVALLLADFHSRPGSSCCALPTGTAGIAEDLESIMPTTQPSPEPTTMQDSIETSSTNSVPTATPSTQRQDASTSSNNNERTLTDSSMAVIIISICLTVITILALIAACKMTRKKLQVLPGPSARAESQTELELAVASRAQNDQQSSEDNSLFHGDDQLEMEDPHDDLYGQGNTKGHEEVLVKPKRGYKMATLGGMPRDDVVAAALAAQDAKEGTNFTTGGTNGAPVGEAPTENIVTSMQGEKPTDHLKL